MATISTAQIQFFPSVNSQLPVISINMANVIRVSCTLRFTLRDADFIFPFPIPQGNPFFTNNFTLSVVIIKQHIDLLQPVNSLNRITYTTLATKSKALKPAKSNFAGTPLKVSIDFTKRELFGSGILVSEFLSSIYGYLTLINNGNQNTAHKTTNLISIAH